MLQSTECHLVNVVQGSELNSTIFLSDQLVNIKKHPECEQ